MHPISATVSQILAKSHHTEYKAIINGTNYYDDTLVSISVTGDVMSKEVPSVGNTISRTVSIRMICPEEYIPIAAGINLFARIVSDDGENGDWIPKGEFFVDKREKERIHTGEETEMIIKGFDAMLKGEQDYNPTGNWPKTDQAVVSELCGLIGVESDWVPNKNYSIPKPDGYSVREVFGYIAAMYAGNLIIKDNGRLDLLRLGVVQ